jgi:hypothetical protein
VCSSDLMERMVEGVRGLIRQIGRIPVKKSAAYHATRTPSLTESGG